MIRPLAFGLAAFMLFESSLGISTVADVVSPTTDWTAITYTNPNQYYYFDDQQTGNRDSDIVGNAAHPAFYVKFDDLGTASRTDGLFYMRVRVGSDRPQAGTFDNVLLVGIDANQDAALDLFVGVDNQGSNTNLSIWDPGTGANTSPATTSIISPPAYAELQTASNYDFSAVTSTNDPTASSFDVDADGDNDYFLSLRLDFAQIVAEMNAIAGIAIDESTSVNYVLATSNNDNSLNQDMNGADGGVGSSLTWSQLGVFSNSFSMNPAFIPEPGAVAFSGLMSLFLLVGWGFRRRRRQGPPTKVVLPHQLSDPLPLVAKSSRGEHEFTVSSAEPTCFRAPS